MIMKHKKQYTNLFKHYSMMMKMNVRLRLNFFLFFLPVCFVTLLIIFEKFMKAPLTTQTKFVSVILGSKQYPLTNTKQYYYERLKTYCDEACEIYGFILHDRDTIEETGELKFPHIHCAFIMKNAKQRLSTIMNVLSTELELGTLAIQIDKMTSKNGSFKYLIHKGYENKFPYPMEEIQTNIPKDELQCIMDSNEDTMSITYLIDVVREVKGNRLQIMQKIGLTYYHLYRNTIGDIIDELRKETANKFLYPNN